jgi:oligosaccharyltransferase complex subunit alpha (ribophorin I)
MDYSQRRGVAGSDFRTITAALPPNVYETYYRDIIGNVSTSKLTYKASQTTVDLDMRFPLFGGWKSNFYIGYSARLSDFVSAEGNNYKLELDWITPFANVVTDELTFQVILPEGCTDIKSNGAEIGLEGPVYETRLTYLDSKWFGGGRPVLKFFKKNVVSEHEKKLVKQ